MSDKTCKTCEHVKCDGCKDKIRCHSEIMAFGTAICTVEEVAPTGVRILTEAEISARRKEFHAKLDEMMPPGKAIRRAIDGVMSEKSRPTLIHSRWP